VAADVGADVQLAYGTVIGRVSFARYSCSSVMHRTVEVTDALTMLRASQHP
jgi:hypothetical protein